MLQDTVRVTVRVDKDLKEAAEELFDHLGMNMTTALNVFLRKAVDEKCIPFSIGVKPSNYDIADGELKVAEVTKAFQRAVEDTTNEAMKEGHPVARYDKVNKQAYLEYADGAREYVN